MATPAIDRRGIYYHFMLFDGPDDDVKILIDDEFGYPTEENCRAVWTRFFVGELGGEIAISKGIERTTKIVDLWEPPFSF